MSTIEVCEICDIAECKHIRARRSGIALDRHIPFQSSLLVRDWTPAQGIATPWLRLREAFGEVDTVLASHPMAAPLKPRTSTLRVKAIRWKRYSPIADSETIKLLSNLGASVRLSYEAKSFAITVTWPNKP